MIAEDAALLSWGDRRMAREHCGAQFSCDFRNWPIGEVASRFIVVRSVGLTPSSSHFDPLRTFLIRGPKQEEWTPPQRLPISMSRSARSRTRQSAKVERLAAVSIMGC